jgi:hypothetical protein
MTSPLYDRALELQKMLIARATGGLADSARYAELRDEVLKGQYSGKAPVFLRRCRDLDSFWAWIKSGTSTYAERRQLLAEEFGELLDALEFSAKGYPSDHIHSAVLTSVNAEEIERALQKALARRETDPEGAITAARTLLETVLKHILTDLKGAADVPEDGDLPRLYKLVAKELSLAPEQHVEEAFKMILGGAISVVNGLSTLRNRIGDAHGSGPKRVRPSPRHAALAVNMAGALATYLIETSEARSDGS